MPNLNRRLLLCSFLAFQMSLTFAQGYFHLRMDGNVPEGYFLDKIYESTKVILLNEPNNSQMSKVDSIPFDFNFYGQNQRHYRVSDNGYLCFDTTQTNSKLPSANYPANSILGFWKDFKLQKLPDPNQGVGIQVYSYTVGTAPNRSHIVQFFGLSLANDFFTGPITNASIYAFAIVFHEGGDGRFDLIYTPFGDKNQKAAIGCVNQDNTEYKLLNDSLNFLPFQFSFEPQNFIVYEFYQGTQPEYDLSLKKVNLNAIYPVNAVANFSGSLFNRGTQTIQSLTLNYSINQSDTISYALTGLNIKPNGESLYNFLHPFSWTSGAAGSLNNVNFWLSEPNGQVDEDSINSHFSKVVLRNNNNYTAPRHILFEEGTGAWCGYCPDAHLVLSQAKSQYGDKVIAVSYHNDDSMSNAPGDEFLKAYISSYPDALLDRKVFLGSTATWLDEVASRVNGNSPVEIYIEMKSFNASTREITFQVRVKFSDYYYGKLNIGSIVTEDRVRGNASPNWWSQNNYYSKDHNGGVGGNTHPLYNEKEYMDGYIHNSVMKDMPGGVWGVSGIIPEYVTPNSEYTRTFTYSLPPAQYVNYALENNTQYCSTRDDTLWNEGRNIPAYIRLIGYVAFDDSLLVNRNVINARQESLWNLVGLKDEFIKDQLLVYPNPTQSTLYINIADLNLDNLILNVYDAQGKLVKKVDYSGLAAGNQILMLDTADLEPGVYSLNLSSATNVWNVKIIKS